MFNMFKEKPKILNLFIVKFFIPYTQLNTCLTFSVYFFFPARIHKAIETLSPEIKVASSINLK